MQKSKEDHIYGFLRVYLWAAELLYHQFAWAYDAVAWLVSFGYWPQWRRDALHYLLPGRILETGFGTGTLLMEMVQEGFDVIGLEPSKPMQKVALRKMARKGVQAKRLMGCTQQLPFQDMVFESVLSTFPTNYIFDGAAQREILRTLKYGGRWVIIGMGLRFKSALKNKLVGWIMGNVEHQWIQNFTHRARQVGFRVSVTDHQTDAYCLPVMLLERSDD